MIRLYESIWEQHPAPNSVRPHSEKVDSCNVYRWSRRRLLFGSLCNVLGLFICYMYFEFPASLLFSFFKPVYLLTGVTCIRLNLNTSLQSVHWVKADVCLFIETSLQGRETSTHFCFMLNNQQFQGICYNLSGIIVFTCLFYRTLEFLVTRVRVFYCTFMFIVH